MNVHIFQHVDFEGPGMMENWLLEREHRLTYTYFFDEKHTMPPIHEVDALIVMGGPMNVYEEAKYPWLLNEKRFIREMIGAEKPVLGICLGAQLIAVSQGAEVYKNEEPEIGWFPVLWHETAAHWLNAPLPKEQMFFHWHGDTFTLPPDAQLQASTLVCRNQFFTIGDRVAGIQFHPELGMQEVATMYANGGEIPVDGNYVQQGTFTVEEYMIKEAHQTMESILHKLFS